MYLLKKIVPFLPLFSFFSAKFAPISYNPLQLQQQSEYLLDLHNQQAQESIPFPLSEKFTPFAECLIVPAGSTLFFWGDLHGDAHALYATLNHLVNKKLLTHDFKLTNQNTYLIFLGDYVDRGHDGIEVILTLLKLKLNNPEHVFLVRGNHEDLDVNNRCGFIQELNLKFSKTALRPLIQKVSHLYETLPVVLYIGIPDINNHINYIQCCHGGMEIGFNPHELLNIPLNVIHAYAQIHELTRIENFKHLQTCCPHITDFKWHAPLRNITSAQLEPIDIGFMWSDFNAWRLPLLLDDSTTDVTFKSNRGSRALNYGKIVTNAIIKATQSDAYTLRAVFRGHQHNESMPGIWHNRLNKGVYSLWENTIFTLVASPTPKRTPTISFTSLKTKANFDNWVVSHWYTDNQKKWENKETRLAHWQNADPWYH